MKRISIIQQILVTLLINFSALFPLSGMAKAQKQGQLLTCLAKEEEKIHKSKSIGPTYYLNQLFFNELVGLGEIELNQEYYKPICEQSRVSPSVLLLKYSLLQGTKIFVLSSNSTAAVREYNQNALSQFTDSVAHIFIRYLAHLRIQTSYPKCFEENMPELLPLFEKIKYLEDEIDMKQILPDKSKIEKMFDKITNVETILKACNEKQDKLIQAKMKNKQEP